jgi:hypothetical protein
MPTTRVFKSRIAGQAELSPGAVAFLMDAEYDPALGDGLAAGNEHAHLLSNDDGHYVMYGDGMRKVSGMSARQLVEQYGDQYLRLYQKEHPGEYPRWWYRFNGGDDDVGC